MLAETSHMSRKNASPKRPAPPPTSGKPGAPLHREGDGPLRATLDRLFSKLGVASRSTAQEWIRAGRVSVNQRVVRLPDTWVSWPADQVSVDNEPVREEAKRFLLFHKPKGVITTQDDEKGRRTIFDVLPTRWRALQAVGRLDQATSGLLLLTNDSALSSFLTDPRHAVPRRYLVTVRGGVTEGVRQAALTGLLDRGERLQCAALVIQKASGRESHLEVTLTEGKNREIRRLFKALGHEVTRLRRIQYGPFLLGNLQPGSCRELLIDEARKMLSGVPFP